MPQTEDIIEVEWQFGAESIAPVTGWLRAAAVPGYTVTPAGAKDVRDTYFDTADWRFTRGRYTLRIRKKKDGAEATLKAAASYTDGMRSRRELTEQVPAPEGPAIVAAPGTVGATVRLIAGPKPVGPLFDLQQHRELFMLADAEGTIGEISADETEIVAPGKAPVKLVRVEVEVDAGAVERARRFVELFIVAAALVEAPASKFESALAASGQRPVGPETDLGPATVTATSTAAEAAYAIFRKHFTTFVTNEPGTRVGEDIEALHDMRVSARRLRAAMSAFRPYVPATWERIRLQLGWVAAALGEVRDLDVQLERMAEWRAESDPEAAAALDGVEALLAAQRGRARKRMLLALNSRRYALLVARIAAALRRGPATRPLEGRQPVTAVAPGVISKRYRRLKKMGDAIDPTSPAASYHELRIDGKKLRYACEFFGPIYGDPATDFARRVTALQDVLGLHQDAEVAVTMLHDMATKNGRRLGPATLLAMGAIAERYRRHAIELRAQFPSVYKPLAKDWRPLEKALAKRSARA